MTELPPFRYETVPYKHQDIEFKQTRDYQYWALFWEMGTGKSKVCVDTMQWLYLKGEIDLCVIVAEKGYYQNWALSEIPTHFPKDVPIRVRVFKSAAKAEEQRLLREICRPEPGVLDVLVINIESMSGDNMSGTKFAEVVRKTHRSTLVILDESTTIKDPNSKRSKTLTSFGKRCQYRRILTGTPVAQSPLDIYAQANFLKHGLLGFQSYTAFRSFYTERVNVSIYVRGEERMVPKIIGYRELDDLADRMQPFSSRLCKSDCLDLPEKVYVPLYVDPTDDQAMHLRSLKKELLTIINNNLLTVENALSVLTKSLQIASGHIKDESGRVHRIPTNKTEALRSTLAQIPDGKKIIVWAYFREDVDIICETLQDMCPVFNYTGIMGADEREQSIKAFRNHEGKCVFLSSPRVAGKGLTLVESDYSFYYTNGFSLEQRLQSEDRNHRIGQVNRVTYYDAICRNSPDMKVVEALKNKRIVSETLLENITSFFTEDGDIITM